ncbi:MAG: hypothetical protein ACRCZF_09480, partial [Gemmataceae bacterium]
MPILPNPGALFLSRPALADPWWVLLQERLSIGYQVTVVETDSDGGQQWEELVRNAPSGTIIDCSWGTLLNFTPSAIRQNRGTAAALAGRPQIIIPAGLESGTPEQLDAIGKELVEKASASRGWSAIVLPTWMHPGPAG